MRTRARKEEENTPNWLFFFFLAETEVYVLLLPFLRCLVIYLVATHPKTFPQHNFYTRQVTVLPSTSSSLSLMSPAVPTQYSYSIYTNTQILFQIQCTKFKVFIFPRPLCVVSAHFIHKCLTYFHTLGTIYTTVNGEDIGDAHVTLSWGKSIDSSWSLEWEVPLRRG